MLSPEMIEEITRYLSYGWEWHVVCNLIQYRHELNLSATALKQAYAEACHKKSNDGMSE